MILQSSNPRDFFGTIEMNPIFPERRDFSDLQDLGFLALKNFFPEFGIFRFLEFQSKNLRYYSLKNADYRIPIPISLISWFFRENIIWKSNLFIINHLVSGVAEERFHGFAGSTPRCMKHNKTVFVLFQRFSKCFSCQMFDIGCDVRPRRSLFFGLLGISLNWLKIILEWIF